MLQPLGTSEPQDSQECRSLGPGVPRGWVHSGNLGTDLSRGPRPCRGSSQQEEGPRMGIKSQRHAKSSRGVRRNQCKQVLREAFLWKDPAGWLPRVCLFTGCSLGPPPYIGRARLHPRYVVLHSALRSQELVPGCGRMDRWWAEWAPQSPVQREPVTLALFTETGSSQMLT